jgi:hypothetical protein
LQGVVAGSSLQVTGLDISDIARKQIPSSPASLSLGAQIAIILCSLFFFVVSLMWFFYNYCNESQRQHQQQEALIQRLLWLQPRAVWQGASGSGSAAVASRAVLLPTYYQQDPSLLTQSNQPSTLAPAQEVSPATNSQLAPPSLAHQIILGRAELEIDEVNDETVFVAF